MLRSMRRSRCKRSDVCLRIEDCTCYPLELLIHAVLSVESMRSTDLRSIQGATAVADASSRRPTLSQTLQLLPRKR